MAQSVFFGRKELVWIGEGLRVAETLAEDYFSVDLEDSGRFPYDLRTLAELQGLEVTNRAFAQVCKYEYRKADSSLKGGGGEFYRICLQDHRMLDAAKTETPLLLRALILYVITHELIHVIRFSTDPKRFHLDLRERTLEERAVHQMTYELLKTVRDPQIDTLLDRYRPWREESAQPPLGKAEP